MTIFRRLSKNTLNNPGILQALARPSALLLGDFENKGGVFISSEFQAAAEGADASSIGTSHSNGNHRDFDESVGSLSLSQTFGEFSVKLDDKNSSVRVMMEVPEHLHAEDLRVQVDDGILRVTGDIPKTTETMEQFFQLDEQSLDLNKITARLSDGILTITAPKKDAEEATLVEALPILSEKPPKICAASHKVVIVDVPGVEKDKMHVSYGNGKLRIAASRHFGRVRSFKRTIPVDIQQFDADRLQTYLHNGRLAVIIPPKEVSVSRTIKVQTDDNQVVPRAA